MILLHRFEERVARALVGRTGTETHTRTRTESSDQDRHALLGTETVTAVRNEAVDPDPAQVNYVIPSPCDRHPHQQKRRDR